MSKKNNNNQIINEAEVRSFQINVGLLKDNVVIWPEKDRVMLTINGVTFILNKKYVKIIRSILKNKIDIRGNSEFELSDQYYNIYSIKISHSDNVTKFTLALTYEERVKEGDKFITASVTNSDMVSALKVMAKYVF